MRFNIILHQPLLSRQSYALFFSAGHRADPLGGSREPGRQGQLHEGRDRWQVRPIRLGEGGHADVHVTPCGQQPEPAMEGDV